MKEIGIGILGFGTVGAGVVEGLQANADLIAERLGARLVIRGIADLDLEKDRGVSIDRSLLTRDAEAVIRNPAVDIVVELIGGKTIARSLIIKALEMGKPVVTANKALLAENGTELFLLARERKTDLFFEASVGGGIPIVKALREGLAANKIERIYGILNGTCNYILTRMEQEHLKFDRVLKEAQAAGYAEADPSLDIDGYDTAHKAAILASLAYGFPVPMSVVQVEGIRGLAETDIEYALGLGYRIKLLAVVKNQKNTIDVRVHPALVPLPHALASVSGVYNAVMVEGDIVGQTLYYGRGAGRRPTASAVIGDLIDVALNLCAGSAGRVSTPVLDRRAYRFQEPGEVEVRYYMRLALLDKPGVLGQVASILGQNEISIASVLQKETHAGKHVPVVIVTHRALEKQFRAAMVEIEKHSIIGARNILLRIEDLGLARQ